ncbi:MAG: hypothetical protein ACI9FB_001693, partial [Candidatus Azotimanducaceae bacterium]
MKSKVFVVALVALLAGAFFYFDFGQYFSLEYIKSQQAELDLLVQEDPVTSAMAFFAV